jgi:predicted homoserine dehydrogenase-like protein
MIDPSYIWTRKRLMKEKSKIKVGIIGASSFTTEILTCIRTVT